MNSDDDLETAYVVVDNTNTVTLFDTNMILLLLEKDVDEVEVPLCCSSNMFLEHMHPTLLYEINLSATWQQEAQRNARGLITCLDKQQTDLMTGTVPHVSAFSMTMDHMHLK